MDESGVQSKLINYINQELLQSKDVSVDPETPLLEWGILNSLNIARIISFIRETYQIHIPPDKIVGENFKNISSISQLVLHVNNHLAVESS